MRTIWLLQMDRWTNAGNHNTLRLLGRVNMKFVATHIPQHKLNRSAFTLPRNIADKAIIPNRLVVICEIIDHHGHRKHSITDYKVFKWMLWQFFNMHQLRHIYCRKCLTALKEDLEPDRFHEINLSFILNQFAFGNTMVFLDYNYCERRCNSDKMWYRITDSLHYTDINDVLNWHPTNGSQNYDYNIGGSKSKIMGLPGDMQRRMPIVVAQR